MNWFGYFAIALAAHVGLAGYVLKRNARGIGWRISYYRVVLGQLVVSIAACLGVVIILTAAAVLGLLGSYDADFLFVALGLAAFFLLWWLGQNQFAGAMANRARGVIVPTFRLRKICTSTFRTMLLGYGGVALGALVIWGVTGPPPDAVAGDATQAVIRTESDRRGIIGQVSSSGVLERGQAQAVGAGPPPPSRTSGKSDVLAAMDAWVDAWSKQDVDRYFTAYATGFSPSHKQSREAWEALRRQHIANASHISVRITEPEVMFTRHDTALVKFRQHYYDSNRLNESSSKTLVLTKTEDGWKIVEELGGS